MANKKGKIQKKAKHNQIPYDRYSYNFFFDLVPKPEFKETFVSIMKAEHYEISEFVKYFKIYKCFDEFYFPIVRLTIFVNKRMCIKLNKVLEDSKFQFRLTKYKNSLIDEYEIEGKSEGLVEESIPLMPLLPVNYDRRKYEEIDITNDLLPAGEEDGFEQSRNIRMDFELFAEEHLEILKTPIEGVLDNTTLDNAVLYCFHDFVEKGISTHAPNSPLSKKLFFYPIDPENNAKIEEIILPHKNLSTTLEYLQSLYGFYKYGLRLFLDYDRYYCLANHKRCDYKVPDGEYNYIHIRVIDVDKMNEDYVGSRLVKNSTTYESKKVQKAYERYYRVGAVNLNMFEFADRINKESSGEDIQSLHSTFEEYSSRDEAEDRYSRDNLDTGLVDKDANKTSLNIGRTNSQKGNKKTKYYYETSSNPFTEDILVGKNANMNLRLLLRLESFDFNIMTPMKSYYINFLNADFDEFDGLYQLNTIVHDFVGDGYRRRSLTSIAIFDRFNPNIENGTVINNGSEMNSVVK